MRALYSQHALDGFLASVRARRGWDFSGMHELRQPVPWDYHDIVQRYLRPSDVVLDVGTGVGEPLWTWPPRSVTGWGSTQIRRWCGWHAPFGLSAVVAHLRPGGYFITQQVGEREYGVRESSPGPVAQPASGRAAVDRG
jgi:hypothetical protein